MDDHTRKGRALDTPQEERQFELAQEQFGINLLRQARQRASELPPAAHGQPPDTPLSEAASEAFGGLLGHIFALPEDKRTTALLMVASGMIVEHLRVTG